MYVLSRRPPIAVALALLSSGAGCLGAIDDPSGGGLEEGATGAAGGGLPMDGESIDLSTDMRRLTAHQYDRTVQDLFGLAALGPHAHPAAAFPEDDESSGFAAGGALSALQLEYYVRAAMEISEQVVSTSLPCSAADPACARQVIDAWGPRAYRRPLTEEEAGRLEALARSATGSAGIALAVEAILLSPSFLYRVELGEGVGATVPLTAYERSSRLSYFLWGSMPDDELFAAAADGRLDDAAEIAREADRMLRDERARGEVRHFFDELLQLDYGEAGIDDALAGALRESVGRFVDHVVWEDDGTLATLLTAPYGFADAQLAPYFGATAPGEMQLVDLDPAVRAGILTQPGVLAAHSATDVMPVYRGKLIRTQLLCDSLSAPPGVPDPPVVEPGVSTRERLRQHREDPGCASCHTLMDPLGFGLDGFDALGRSRTTDEGGVPIDTTGEIVDTNGVPTVPFDGAVELAHALAEHESLARCTTRQWYRFAMGRAASPDERDAVTAIEEDFRVSGNRFHALLEALVQSDAFLYRRIAAEGAEE